MAFPRQLAAPAYLVAFALLCIPPFDAIMQVLPLNPGTARWRWGAFGLLSNAMMIPLTGLLIAFVASTVFEHVRFQRVLGAIALLVAVGTLVGLAMFALDALQIRPEVKPQALKAFKVATSTAALKAILGLITFGWFGISAFKGPKPARAAKSSKSGGLIFGSRSSSKAPVAGPGTANVNQLGAPR